MNAVSNTRLPGWIAVILAGVVLPAGAMLFLREAAAAPIVAVGLMGVAMIAAATAGRWWMGVALALLRGVALILLARALGLPSLSHPFSTGLAMVIASMSFAARGALFSRAIPGNGWLMALFVVTGEAAMLTTAAYLPAWLLVLLPAQWARTALQTTLSFTMGAATAALLALAGTAAATLLVVRLWPRRWPYALMFSAWLALSALVWNSSVPRPATAGNGTTQGHPAERQGAGVADDTWKLLKGKGASDGWDLVPRPV